MTELSAYSEMEQLKRQVDTLSKDHLAGLVKALLDQPEINQSPQMLAFLMRGLRRPRNVSSMDGVDTVATLKELNQGMLYKEREGKRQWMRIVSIGEVKNLDNGGFQQYRDAIVEPAFSHVFVEAKSTRIFGYERPFDVKLAAGREPR